MARQCPHQGVAVDAKVQVVVAIVREAVGRSCISGQYARPQQSTSGFEYSLVAVNALSPLTVLSYWATSLLL